VYASGHYHRKGKPGVTNAHGGDVYGTQAQALYDAEPDKGYLFTTSFVVRADALTDEQRALLIVNGEDSIPEPLSVSRAKRAAERQREIEAFYAPQAPAKLYKPTHGGYPTPGSHYQ
jgi:hypothetical protein